MGNNSLASTKRRIGSVKATLKITKAMDVVATAKVKTYKDKLGNSYNYLKGLKSILSRVIAAMGEDEETINSYAKGDKKLILFITSSLGLCGAYNNNMFRLFNDIYKQGDKVLVIGSKGLNYLTYRHIPCDDRFVSAFHAFDYSVSRQIGNYLMEQFKTGDYKEVILISTLFRNSLNFEPFKKKLLPFDKIEKGLEHDSVEPSAKEVYKMVLPQYINSTVYDLLLNSLVSEFSSRRNAMENASDNAEEIIEELQLNYNKARQAAITQEITEVVSGANVSR